ncbi:hypothetical protein PsorP6_014980 [Peronosclerospora sorghi]|uniref:Uncharacterized protein n=1 Tax=Peronosclerospora sorghi TaxID=230839 RepID=A0ACC0VSY8_9STRA|nr:hypothetical protein PsorP6_014980 [Peronosclerospora sorghi]
MRSRHVLALLSIWSGASSCTAMDIAFLGLHPPVEPASLFNELPLAKSLVTKLENCVTSACTVTTAISKDEQKLLKIVGNTWPSFGEHYGEHTPSVDAVFGYEEGTKPDVRVAWLEYVHAHPKVLVDAADMIKTDEGLETVSKYLSDELLAEDGTRH